MMDSNESAAFLPAARQCMQHLAGQHAEARAKEKFFFLTLGERRRAPAGVPKRREEESEIPIPILADWNRKNIRFFL